MTTTNPPYLTILKPFLNSNGLMEIKLAQILPFKSVTDVKAKTSNFHPQAAWKSDSHITCHDVIFGLPKFFGSDVDLHFCR